MKKAVETKRGHEQKAYRHSNTVDGIFIHVIPTDLENSLKNPPSLHHILQ